jgi:hypothetical protein
MPQYQSLPIEPLESRRLLSLVVDVRASDGSTSATVDHLGQTLNLQLWAVVTGANNDPTQDALSDVIGSILTSGVGYKPVQGDLANSANVSPFDANGAAPGNPADLNGDGNLDIGSNDNASVAGFFDARAGSAQRIPPGIASNGSLEFEIATFDYTVTNLNQGGETDITFRPQQPVAGNVSGVWIEDNTAKSNLNGSFGGGTPFTITAPSVFPTGPIAIDDSFNGVPGQPSIVDVLQNDFDDTGTIDPTTVAIVTQPNQGGSVSVDPVNGEVTYTPSGGFVGTETFTYTVSDNHGLTSPAATVTFLDTSANLPPPVANNDAASDLLNAPATINVAANDMASSPAIVLPSTIQITTQPTNGTATLDASGNILYTPTSGFLGTDTLAYTIADSNGKTSNAATVNVSVGLAVGSAIGDHRAVKYTDPDGTNALVTLSRGTATLQFVQATASVSANGAVVTVTGPDTHLVGASLTGTTAQSVLSIRTLGGGDGVVDLGDIATPNGDALGALIAPGANLDENLNLGSVRTLVLRNVSDETVMNLGTAGGAVPGTIVLGDVDGSTVSSLAPIRVLSVRSWAGGGAVSAPSIRTLLSAHDFAASVTATGVGVARVTGALAGGTWSLTDATVIIAGSVAPAWSAALSGSLGTFVARAGGLGSTLHAATIGVVSITGDLTGSLLSDTSIRSARITGAINGGTITATAGDILALIAGSFDNAVVTAGGVLRTVAATARSGVTFSDTQITAVQIQTAILGTINTQNTKITGLSATKFTVVNLIANARPVRLGPSQLDTQQHLADFLTLNQINLGDFEITIQP